LKKVLFIEPVIAHYRRDTFKLIFSNGYFSCAILAGREYEGVRPAYLEQSILDSYITFSLFGHRFHFLKNALWNVKHYKPNAIVCSGVDFHHLHTILIFIWAKLHGIKFIWWSHATEGKQGWIGFIARKFLYRSSAGVLAYSKAGLLRLQKFGMQPSKVVVVGNSMNNEDYGLNVNHADSDRFTILFSGRITPEKKLDVLVKAIPIIVRKIPSLRCLIIGGGNINPIVNLAKELGVEKHIEFLGPAYGSDLQRFFALAHLFVYPGGIGLSMAHALSYGLPVITTDAMHEHGPEIELLKPGVNGDFFQDRNPHSLSNSITIWAEKLNTNTGSIRNACRETLAEFGYFPESVSSKVVSFLIEKLD